MKLNKRANDELEKVIKGLECCNNDEINSDGEGDCVL